jgi:phosphate acetyltransferase
MCCSGQSPSGSCSCSETSIIETIRTRAKQSKQTIVLAEPEDDRVLQAADYLMKNQICEIVLIGDKETLTKRSKELSLNVANAIFVNPRSSSLLEKFSQRFFERRKHKGVTIDQAKEIVSDNLFFGASLVGCGYCDGMVAGSIAPTPKVIQSGLFCIGTAAGLKTVSSFFLMATPRKEYGVNGAFIYADAGCVPDPTPEQMVDIAIASAGHCRMLLEAEPIIAFLSFSTYGSAEHPKVEKVRTAVKLFKERNTGLKGDGELQLDAAIVKSVGEKKAPGSLVAGKANVLIFPDLDAGNIGYKLTERLAQASATGPILQGLDVPINDLSRGCKWQDIADAACITILQAVDRKQTKGQDTKGAGRPDLN